jgi:hypothetical protein
MSDSELYGEDIRLWFEVQSALLPRLAAGETVISEVDWPHIAEEIEVVALMLGGRKISSRKSPG